MIANPSLHQAAAVHYALDILDSRGRVVRSLPRRRNLILDQGLDGIAVRSWADSFTNAAIGTGTTPTKRDSGTITFSRSGSTVTASAGFFEAADVGRLLKFDTGEEVRISAFTNATTVTTSGSGAIAAAEGTVWYVNQTALSAEAKRSSTYSTDGGANGAIFSSGTWTHKRTFIFSAETGTVNYREIGWSHTSTAGANLFGRALLDGVGVTLVSGQQLRVTVELSVAYSPATPQAFGDIGAGGISTAGTHGVEDAGLVTVVSGTGSGSNAGVLDPHAGGVDRNIVLSSSSSPIVPATSSQTVVAGALSVGKKTLTLGAYSAGTFSRTKHTTFSTTEANSASIRSVFVSNFQSGQGDRSGYRVLFASNQAKTSDQTLYIEFRFSWGRVLNNA